MAEVDFSNARIEVDSTSNQNPTTTAEVLLANGTTLVDSSNTVIGSGRATRLINQQKQLMYNYTGSFTASGTEFYFGTNQSRWKVSNISFSSGDTYVFQVNASLVCN